MVMCIYQMHLYTADRPVNISYMYVCVYSHHIYAILVPLLQNFVYESPMERLFRAR